MIFISKSTIMITIAVIMMSLLIVLEGCDSSLGTTPKQQNTVSQDTISAQPSETEPTAVKQNSLEDELQAQFIKAGWDSKAAQAVIALNQEWFTITKQDTDYNAFGGGGFRSAL